MTLNPTIHPVRQMPVTKGITACLIIGAAMLGFFHGIKLANWQVALEGAQVLAGLVDYPASNPQGMYHRKLWTLLNQAPALVLYLGIPERLLSVIISGLGGTAFYVGVSLVTYAVGRNLLVSLVMPMVVLWTGVAGAAGGITYPVLLLNSPHTYGSFGLSVAVIVLGLAGCGYLRTAAFVIGLAPSIHPSWGVWINLVVCLSLLARISLLKHIAGKIVPWLLAGYFLTGVSLLFWFLQSPNIDTQPSEHIAEYISVFIEKWDPHRHQMTISQLTLKNSWNVTTAFLTGIICVLCMLTRSRSNNKYPQILFTGLFVSTMLATVISMIMLLPPAIVPSWLLAFMPQRLLNISILCFLPLLFGALGWEWQQIDFGRFAIFLLGVIFFKFTELFPGQVVGFIVCLFIFVGLLSSSKIRLSKNNYLSWMLGALIFVFPVVNVSSIHILLDGRSIEYFLTNVFFVLSTTSIAVIIRNSGEQRDRTDHWLLVTAIISIGCGIVFLTGWTGLLWKLEGLAGLEIVASAVFFAYATILIMFRAVISGSGVRIVQGIDQLVKRIPQKLDFLHDDRGDVVRKHHQVVVGIGIVVSVCLFLGSKTLTDAAWTKARFSDRTNNKFWATIAEGDDYLLTGPGLFMIQVRSRRPVLIDGGAIDWLPYIPEAGPAVARILRQVYGVDFFDPPSHRTGKLSPDWSKNLWIQRTVGEWKMLKERYHITNILVDKDWILNLPSLMQNQDYKLYYIP
jgi:hypothetical protein